MLLLAVDHAFAHLALAPRAPIRCVPRSAILKISGMVRLEHDLRDAIAIAKIDEDLIRYRCDSVLTQPLRVTVCADVRVAEFAAGMSALPGCHE